MTHREIVQLKAHLVGHCPCSKAFTCPCKWFKDMGECKCAMEGNITAEKWLEYNLANESDN